MGLRTQQGLDGLAPKKYTEARTVHDGDISYVCFFQYDTKSGNTTFISGIEIRVYPDGKDKLVRFFNTMPSAVQSLLDAETWT